MKSKRYVLFVYLVLSLWAGNVYAQSDYAVSGVVQSKDNEGLVKRYAYVNVEDYRLVTTAETKEQALMEYKRLIGDNDGTPLEAYEIAEIVPVALNGNTTYYIRLKGTDGVAAGFENFVFRAELTLNPSLPFLKAGDKIEIRYEKHGDVYEITTLKVANS